MAAMNDDLQQGAHGAAALPSGRRRPPLFMIALVALFVVAAAGGFLVSWRSLRRAAISPPASSAPAPRIDRSHFHVVAYPAAGGASLRPPPAADQPAVPLRRAVLLSLGELDAAKDGTVGVWQDDREHAVAVRSLTFVPPANAAELTEKLNDAIRSWGAQTDWRRARVAPFEHAGDGNGVRLVLTDQRGRDRTFDYVVRRDAIEPLSLSGAGR